MQSSTGQYSTQAGDPAHPVQHSVITANSFGFFFRGVNRPFDLGSNLSSSGTIPAGFKDSASAGMAEIIPQHVKFSSKAKAQPTRWYRKAHDAGEQNDWFHFGLLLPSCCALSAAYGQRL